MRFNPAYTSLREPLDPECDSAQILISRKIDRELDAKAPSRSKPTPIFVPPAAELEQQTEQASDLVRSHSALWPDNHPVKKKCSNERIACMLTRVGGSAGEACGRISLGDLVGIDCERAAGGFGASIRATETARFQKARRRPASR